MGFIDMANNESVIVPEELVWLDGRPIVKMVEIAVEALQLPFWSQTLAAKKRVVGLMPLAQFESDTKPRATVSGFVYHFNRCGSTLVSNAFKARSGCFSLSEPFVFQQLLDSEHGTPAQRVEWLKDLMGLHSKALAGICQNFVIKWPGLMALYIAEIEQAFPLVPAALCQSPRRRGRGDASRCGGMDAGCGRWRDPRHGCGCSRCRR